MCWRLPIGKERWGLRNDHLIKHHGGAGWQNVPSSNMPLWHKDCFELKAIEKKQIEERLSALYPHLHKSRTHIHKVVPTPVSTRRDRKSSETSFTDYPLSTIIFFDLPFHNLLPLVKVKVAQLCPTLCDPMDYTWNSPGQNTAVGSLSLLQGIFPTQRSNPSFPHCRQILYLPLESDLFLSLVISLKISFFC